MRNRASRGNDGKHGRPGLSAVWAWLLPSRRRSLRLWGRWHSGRRARQPQVAVVVL